jgi:hypothetical protein
VTAPRSLSAVTEAWMQAPLTPAGESGVEDRANTPPAGPRTPRRNRKFAKPTVPDMSENELLANVREIAKLNGWETYHTHDSRRSDAGWPDLVLASAAQRRTLFIELKKRTGRVSDAQQKWLDLLALCGQEVAVWRPADMPEIVRVLRGQRIGSAA